MLRSGSKRWPDDKMAFHLKMEIRIHTATTGMGCTSTMSLFLCVDRTVGHKDLQTRSLTRLSRDMKCLSTDYEAE